MMVGPVGTGSAAGLWENDPNIATAVRPASALSRPDISGERLFLEPSDAAHVPLTITAAASQTANLFDVKDSGGSVLSRFDASGQLGLPGGSASSPALHFVDDPDTGFYRAWAGQIEIVQNASRTMSIGSNGQSGSLALTEVAFGGPVSRASNTTMRQDPVDGVGTLAILGGTATNPQALNVYSTYTDVSNYERLEFKFLSGDGYSINSAAAGTGTQRELYFQRGATTHIGLKSTGTHLFQDVLFQTDNARDIGASGANRPRHLYLGGAITAGSNITATSGTIYGAAIQAATGNYIRWSTTASLASATDGRVTLQNAARTDFDMLQFGGTAATFPALKRTSAVLETKLADDSDYAAHYMGNDLRVYFSYTDASNYNYLGMFQNGGHWWIKPQAYVSGSELGDALVIATHGNNQIYFNTSGSWRWQILGSTGHMTPYSADTYDFGSTGSAVRSMYANRMYLKEGAAASGDVAGWGQIWVKNDVPNTLWFTDDGGTDWQLGTSGAFTADGDTQITTTTAIALDQATGAEAALTLAYTTNKATSGNDTGLHIDWTDTASPGASYPLRISRGGTDMLRFRSVGSDYPWVILGPNAGGLVATTSGLGLMSGGYDTARAQLSSSWFKLASGIEITWWSGTHVTGGGSFRSAIYGGAADGDIMLSNYAVTDFGLLQFGGTTSSFPALKRSSAALQVRLADDSAFAALHLNSLENGGSGNIDIKTTSANNIRFQTNSSTRFYIDSSGNFQPQVDDTYPLGTSTRAFSAVHSHLFAFYGTDASAANAGTLANAPSAGDPADWIPVEFNGTTRYIPAWA